MSPVPPRAMIEDLFRFQGRAELIGGEIVRYEPGGWLPGHVMMEIAGSLHDDSQDFGPGKVWTGSVVYAIEELPSGRQSFSPNLSYHLGPRPTKPLQYFQGPPTFAVEIRFEADYDPVADRERSAKRADYFAAGILVVWDIDCLAEQIHKYPRGNPTEPIVFGRGDVAEAELAVEGGRLAVDQVFG